MVVGALGARPLSPPPAESAVTSTAEEDESEESLEERREGSEEGGAASAAAVEVVVAAAGASLWPFGAIFGLFGDGGRAPFSARDFHFGAETLLCLFISERERGREWVERGEG